MLTPLRSLPLALFTVAICQPLAYADEMADSAGCSAAALGVVEQNPRYAKIPDNGYLQCKADPSDASRTLVAFVSHQPPSDTPDTNQGSDYDLDVFLVRNNGVVIAQYTGDKVYSDDAIRLWDIGLDTARYHLDKNTRAVGVTAEFGGQGGARGVSWKQITLYTRKGSKLAPVLKNLVVHSTGNGNFECTNDEVGNGDGAVVTTRTISMALTRSHGFADIIVDEAVNETDASLIKGKCVATDQPATHTRYVLKYNGSEYPVPQTLTW